jgi:hypothetical protein
MSVIPGGPADRVSDGPRIESKDTILSIDGRKCDISSVIEVRHSSSRHLLYHLKIRVFHPKSDAGLSPDAARRRHALLRGDDPHRKAWRRAGPPRRDPHARTLRLDRQPNKQTVRAKHNACPVSIGNYSSSPRTHAGWTVKFREPAVGHAILWPRSPRLRPAAAAAPA